VRCRGVELAEHAADLAEFGHQALLGVQSSGGVGDEHVGTARLRRLQRVEGDRGRVGILSLGDHRHAVALAPDLQLCHRGRTERIAGGEHQRTPLVAVAARELADGGGLADTVDPDREQHEWLRRRFEPQGPGHRLQQGDEVAAQGTQQRVRIGELARLHALAQVVDELRRRGDADIRRQQGGFDFVEQVVVEARIA
jgi:hypothetical protein